VIGMKIVGLLLVSALLVIPGAGALQVAQTFKQACLIAVSLALLSVCGGLFFSGLLDLPASGAIILFAGVLFLCCFLWRRCRNL